MADLAETSVSRNAEAYRIGPLATRNPLHSFSAILDNAYHESVGINTAGYFAGNSLMLYTYLTTRMRLEGPRPPAGCMMWTCQRTVVLGTSSVLVGTDLFMYVDSVLNAGIG